jgi:RimJ/RimL family protein N-acetyltransferase
MERTIAARSVQRTEDVLVRRIRRADAPAVERFYATLSSESRRTRFFSVNGRPSHAQSVSFCAPDHDHREGFVAILREPTAVQERIVGHLCLEPAGGHVAEVAIAVADDLQRQGIGLRLLDAGVRWALAEGCTTLTASAWIGNAPIHRLIASLGRPAHARDAGSGIEDIRIDLRTPPAA